MASGGDDTLVYLWDLFHDFEDISPIYCFNGPSVCLH